MYKRYAADKKIKKNSPNKCMVTGKTQTCLGRTRGRRPFSISLAHVPYKLVWTMPHLAHIKKIKIKIFTR
jgi:hypothetical protein